jgi:hypothetical protein
VNSVCEQLKKERTQDAELIKDLQFKLTKGRAFSPSELD